MSKNITTKSKNAIKIRKMPLKRQKNAGNARKMLAGTIARCLVIIADLPDSSELSSRLILDVSSVRSFFIEVVFLRWVGVFEYKNHPKPKKAEIIGVVLN